MGEKEEIVAFFESCYSDYDKHMNKTGHYVAQEDIIKQLFGFIKEPILDLACGTGHLISVLSPRFPTISANDYSPSMARLSKERNPGITITSEDAEILDSYKDKFNTIISCNLFFYLRNKDKALKRWKELLGPGGNIIFLEEYPFVKSKSKEMDKHAEELMSLVKPVPPEQIVDLMAQNGFKLIKKVKTNIDGQHSLYGLVFSLR